MLNETPSDSFVGIESGQGPAASDTDPILPDGSASSTDPRLPNGSAGWIIQGMQYILHSSVVILFFSQTLYSLNA